MLSQAFLAVTFKELLKSNVTVAEFRAKQRLLSIVNAWNKENNLNLMECQTAALR